MPIPKTYQTVIGPVTVGPGESTSLSQCQLVDLTRATQLVLTFRGTFHASATGGAKIQMFPSYDGLNFDTIPWSNWAGEPAEWVVAAVPGQTVQVTSEPISPTPKYLKFKLVNLDGSYSITNASLIVTVQTVG